MSQLVPSAQFFPHTGALLRGNPSLGITSLKTSAAPRSARSKQDEREDFDNSDMSILDYSDSLVEEGENDLDRYEQDDSTISFEDFAQSAATEINLAQHGVTSSYMNELIQDMWTKFNA